MSIDQIVIRSASGYIWLLPGLILYFLWLNRSSRKQPLARVLAVFVFGYYLIGLLTVTGIHEFHAFSPRINWIPFIDMVRGPVDTALNVLLFIPLGIFLPLLYPGFRRAGRIAACGVLLSLLIELLQLFGMGSTDLNDLITNTTGALLGYLLYRLLYRYVPQKLLELLQKEPARVELPGLLAYAFAVMMTVQPLMISALFGLG